MTEAFQAEQSLRSIILLSLQHFLYPPLSLQSLHQAQKNWNMPAQNKDENPTELMKKSPTMSWVLEGDKGRHETA